MTDYVLPEGMTATAASSALAERLTVREGVARVRARAYYDTFDGLLHAAGLVAVWEDGQLALVESEGDTVRARAPLPQEPAKPLFAWDVGGGRLADAVKALIDVRALLLILKMSWRMRPLDVLDREGKTVVRLRVLEPGVVGSGAPPAAALAGSGRSRFELAPRLRVSAVRGYDGELARVARALERCGFEPAARSLVDEGVLASGGTPGGSPVKVRVPLSPSERADRAAVAVLRALLGVIELNLPGTIADLDSEFLHDFRVAVRRTRAVQRELRRAFPATSLRFFRDELRWLQRATGDARDLDVHVLEFEAMRALVPAGMRGDLEPLLAVLRRRRTAARRRMVRALRSDRVSELLAGWGKLLAELEDAGEVGPDAAAPIAELAGARIAKVYRRMVRMGSAIGPESPSIDYHELRKQGKELRYLLELFGAPLFPDDVVRAMVRALKGLQDVLGRHQDREVQVTMLRSVGEELARVGGAAGRGGAARGGGAAALMATGVLIERLEADQLAAREAFAARFAEFASRRQRKLVKDTFR